MQLEIKEYQWAKSKKTKSMKDTDHVLHRDFIEPLISFYLHATLPHILGYYVGSNFLSLVWFP